MQSYDLIIKNGTCVVPATQGTGLRLENCDIGVLNGQIVQIAKNIDRPAKKIIEASGLHILPGVIDTQVHFREPGMTHKEDLDTGTKAAILGGVTSIFEMPNTSPSTTTEELFNEKLKRASGRAWCDYAFFIGGCAENATNLAYLEKLPHCCGIKVFMGSSTGSLLVDDDSVLENILRHGSKRVIIHSEDEKRLRERKHLAIESQDVHDHPLWRDVETAMLSTKRLLSLAHKTGRKVHVLHVSTGEEMDLLKNEKELASVEVLPQHLTLFAPDCYDKLKNYAQQNPPIREKRHLERIWKAVQDGTVDIIGSDHAPHTHEEKQRPYPQSPSGVPGVQTLVPIMLDHVNQGRLPLTRFVEMVSENPRKVFGIKNKGRLETGYDADITIIDLSKEKTIENNWIASRCGWTPFAGMNVKGWPTHTIIRGQVVMENDQIIGSPIGRGVDFE